MNSNQISKAVRLALVAGAVSALATPAAFGADDSTTTTTTTNNQSTAQLGKIEVTGTRIKRTDVETAQPVTIITTQQIKATGLNSVGDILAQLPQIRSVLNAQVNNGNDGSSTIDLRNLGSNRVLVLVNGKRWVGGIGGVVDFTTIPAAIIDHIEILQDGASAIYGSDAISGVVNIITVKNYNGAEANAYLGMYHGDGHTDGRNTAYDFTFGTSGDKSAVLMSAGYTEQDQLLAGDRDISKEPYVGTGSDFGSSRTPAGRFRFFPIATNGTDPAGTCPGGLATNGAGYCDLTLKSTPVSGVPAGSDFRDFTAPDHYNFAPLNFLVAPIETTNLYVQGHYDLADNLTFTSEGLFSNRSSATQLAEPVLDVGEAASNTSIFISKTNPYNPLGVDLVGQSSAPCVTAKTCDVMLDLGRRYVEAGPRKTDFSQNTFHFDGGFKGYFNMMGGEWDWDAGYNFSHQDETSHESNVVNLLNLGQALGPAFLPAGAANTPGNYECGTAAAPIAGCVPTDLFGGAGSITPAMVAFTTFNPTSTSGSNQRDYTANLTGDLFDMPAGPVGAAIGAEYLEVDGFFHPDELSILNLNAEGSSTPTDGRERTDGEYVEFNIPILADQPFAKDMNLDIAERWSQFKWIGGNPGSEAASLTHSDSAQTGRAALKWQTSDSLLLRAAWSQGFRLPEISEFFANQSTSAVTATDPCVNAAFAAATPNCNGKHNSNGNGQINTLVGGNPGLHPERSISRTVGFVYNPDFIPGFDFSADYFKIDVEQYITSLSDATILGGCYNRSVAPGAGTCDLITVKGGIVSQISAANTNIGSIVTEGVDVSTHYKFPSTSAGDFKLGLDMTFNKVFDRTTPNAASPTGFGTSQLAGWATQSGSTAVSYPKRKGDLTLNWNFGPWSAMYTLRYVGAVYEACNVLDSPGSHQSSAVLCSNATDFVYNEPAIQGFPSKTALPVGRNHIGAVVYHDVNVTYHVDSLNTDFSLGIRNLFGKVPPVAQNAFANSYLPSYDVPGQFFYARIGVKF
ncbi:MAG TPA: TonB-dependent receptor [Gammaproteobacteria bacterium]|jgi:iron complex outermembrane receptor protein